MTLFDHLIVLMFTVIYPAYDFFYSSPKFKEKLAINKSGVRIREYLWSIAWIWSLTTITLVIWIFNKRALANLGLDITIGWPVWLGLILFFIGLSYILYVNNSVKNDTEQRSSIHAKLKVSEASVYLPRTRNDFIWFILVSISAGICEELLFRGFLMWYIKQFSTTVIAIILSSILFGLAHSYQGRKGVLQSLAAGLVLSVIYVFTGSLWIPIALHIFGDAYSGMLGFLAFNED